MPQPLRVDVGSATAFTGAYWAGERRGTGSAGVGGAKDTTNRTEVSAGGADFGSSSARPNACRAPRGCTGREGPQQLRGEGWGGAGRWQPLSGVERSLFFNFKEILHRQGCVSVCESQVEGVQGGCAAAVVVCGYGLCETQGVLLRPSHHH